MNKSKNLYANCGLLFSVTMWSSTIIIIKDNVETLDPLVLITYRFFIAAIPLIFFLLYRKKNVFQNIKEGIFLGLLLWIINASQAIGLIFTTATNSGFIAGLFVVFVPIFSFIFLKKFPAINKIIGVIVSIIGLWILTGGLKEINKGDIITILTAMASASHIIYTGKYIKNRDPLVLNLQQFFIVALLSLITGLITDNNFTNISIQNTVSILYLAVFATCAAHVIQFLSQKYVTPIRTALIFALEPVLTALFAWVFGSERLHSHQIIGGAFIFLAIIVSEIPLRNKILSNK